MKNKKGIEQQEVGRWVIGLLLLTVVIVSIVLLKNKGIDIIKKFIEIIRYGR